MKPKNVLIVLSIILSFISCTKTEEIEKFPLITTEGKNTFGCLVTGKAWIPETDGGLFNERLFVRYEGKSFNIGAKIQVNNDAIRQGLFVTANFTDLGVYQIPPPPFDGEIYFNSN